jgi:hypothetical protein
MPRYLVVKMTYHSQEVDASDPAEAIKLAEEQRYDEWEFDDTEYEVDVVDTLKPATEPE